MQLPRYSVYLTAALCCGWAATVWGGASEEHAVRIGGPRPLSPFHAASSMVECQAVGFVRFTSSFVERTLSSGKTTREYETYYAGVKGGVRLRLRGKFEPVESLAGSLLGVEAVDTEIRGTRWDMRHIDRLELLGDVYAHENGAATFLVCQPKDAKSYVEGSFRGPPSKETVAEIKAAFQSLPSGGPWPPTADVARKLLRSKKAWDAAIGVATLRVRGQLTAADFLDAAEAVPVASLDDLLSEAFRYASDADPRREDMAATVARRLPTLPPERQVAILKELRKLVPGNHSGANTVLGMGGFRKAMSEYLLTIEKKPDSAAVATALRELLAEKF
jgi:hypothetical protein